VAADAELSEDEFQSIYGRLEPLSPLQVGELFAGAEFEWWICGGWSAELAQVPRRLHADIEVGVRRDQLPEVRRWLANYHLWDVRSGTLRFLGPEDELPADQEQIWVRRNAYSPWLMDVMPTPVKGPLWVYKRDERLTRPLEQVVERRDGIPYQRPEVTLLYKARRVLERDEADFDAVAPHLSRADRAWLHDAIEMTEPPGHPWLERLARLA